MATYQGERYVAEQLNSIACQSFSDWTLTVSDDGSTDGTLQLVTAFQARVRQSVRIVSGPRLGATKNFLQLVLQKADAAPTDLFSFCDQDDVWLPDKLARAVAHFDKTAPTIETPYLYCSRTAFVDAHLESIGLSRIPRQPPSFANALVENIASGNTMVFNGALRKFLNLVGPHHSVWHDWTTYQVACGCGGVVAYDAQPCIRYRQHRLNVFGARSGLTSVLVRLKYVLSGEYRRWGDLTELAMAELKPHLTLESQAMLDIYRSARRERSGFTAALRMSRAGIVRQSRTDQLVLSASLCLKLA